jgi:glutamate-1-semialdehyde 2,1-aminomutase
MATASHYKRVISDTQFKTLIARERADFIKKTPKAANIYETAKSVLHRGVPMPWMSEWDTPHPLYMDHANGAHLWDVDGNKYVDFCLGDTGSMFGHSPKATADAVIEQINRGITSMLATEDATYVAQDLKRRFNLPFWQIAMTATDANRCVIRLCRAMTGRPNVLVVNQCYHGTLDESLVKLEDGKVVKRSIFDNHPSVPAENIARVVEFNDEAALEKELAHQDVACVLIEPVMTNCGMVLPTPTYHKKLRELTKKYGAYLLIDETHTISTGPGGYTAAYGLEPDLLVLGKAIAGGIPCAAYGFTQAFLDDFNQKLSALGTPETAFGEMGIGGTLSANALVVHAMRATLEHVATDAAYAHMIRGTNRLADGLEHSIAKHKLPWSVTRCGARAELQFCPTLPQNGAESVEVLDWDLIIYTHTYLMNRGAMITPFHNMMLVSPVTTDADIDLLIAGWDSCMEELARLSVS